ncbi:Lar family restriction alleviation protein [Frisingicoccus sp.]|uniref:Lar family restriction alleviation protein n=1 Tax=Frisingicoccus sp. TaxID=1918627 RepID=UPI003AB1B84F
MRRTLKPCPFCGGEGGLFIDKYEKYFTGCASCGFYYGIEIENGVELQDGWRAVYDTEEDAAYAWNTRKPMDRIVQEMEKEYLGKLTSKEFDNGIIKAIEIVRGTKGVSEGEK